MTERLEIRKINETWVKLICERDVLEELYNEFQFEVPGARYTPLYKARAWDGKIKLVDKRGKTYVGLVPAIKKFCESRGYDVDINGISKTPISPADIAEHFESLNLPKELNGLPFIVQDYQYMAVYKSIKEKHSIILSPTASGKSLIIYALYRALMAMEDSKILIVVPTVNLVNQMKNDFTEYAQLDSFDVDENVHKIFSGQDKNTEKPVTVSTWQSLKDMKAEYFEQFDAVIIDEVHLAKAKSLTYILESCVNAKFKTGLTGSLDKSLTHKMMLTALFGAPYRCATTRELIERGQLSDIKIKALVLDYEEEIKKAFCKAKYQKEIDFIVQYGPRNNFIKNLALATKGNTLILFNFVEKHGKILHELITKEAGDRKVFFVHGATDADDREQVRHLTERNDNVIIIASLGTFSTGVNIKKLHNIIFAQPTKSVIRVLQSIGRGLRKAVGKTHMTLFDIADDLTWKKSINHTYKHFIERLAIYSEEQHEYTITRVKLHDKNLRNEGRNSSPSLY